MKKKTQHGVAVIGGGPAGLAAAIAATESGCRDVILIERDVRLGGILNQCIHDGFGLHRFGEALSGPEYAAHFTERLRILGVKAMLGTIALRMTGDKMMLLSRMGEMVEIEAEAIVLATGCRERACGALSIPGHRPSGVYTAGTAQNFVNMENIMPGKSVAILGSGDVGLIMARRMTLEGARVEAVFEILPYSSGLPRNIRQCLVDYGIPLYLSTTVIEIVGMGRLEGVVTASVDENRRPIKGTERFVRCDTLLLSVGLIPENELARDAGIEIDPVTGGPAVDDLNMTSSLGIFSCGNSLHVHDLVDWVSDEAEKAGRNAAKYASGTLRANGEWIGISPGKGVRYVVPRRITPGSERRGVEFAFRVASPSRDCLTEVISGDTVIKEERHARLHPAEMTRVSLCPKDASRLWSCGAKTVEVRVR
jgi:sarcosine oxidase subunit alpha